MKINGQIVSGTCIETIVIPRGDNPPVVFKAQAVLDYDEFEKLCPKPTPKMMIAKGGKKVQDFTDKHWLAAIEDYNKKQQYYLFIKSLLATPGLEFEKIKITEPDSWLKFEEEFKDAGFTSIEINRIIQGIMIANCLDEAKIKEARDSFVLSQAEPEVLQPS